MNHDDELFAEALALPAPERTLYLDRSCGGDAALRARVEALLASHDAAAKFLELPVTGHAAFTPEETRGDMIGRYKLLEKIGEGGCGVVWMAEQAEPVRRRVALKIIKLGMDTKEVVARFEAERQALAMMDHPNVAKVFDAGTSHTGRPYFVMELVRGIPITRYCDEKNLPTVQRLELFIQACHAIQHAHQKGIIHRDIKPSNILVAQHDDVAVPKVIDFGIAKATQGRLTDATVFTAFAQFIGTPAYMSPEQAEFSGLDIDTRTDIYSLGVVLYELLTGRPPFDPKSLQQAGLDEVRRIIREVEPARPSTRLSTLSDADRTTVATLRGTAPAQLSMLLRGDLDWIVMRALEKNRSRRYETANGLAADLKRHLNNEPVVARPPTAAYRFQKLVRRNTLAFAAASVVALTLIAGLSFSTWSFLREAVQRRTAVEHQTKAELAHEAEKQERLRADAEKITAQRHLYVANMNLAQLAWEQNNIDRLRQLLEATQEFPDRGFEWYYWQRQTHLALKTLRGHLQHLYRVAFSRDGQRIVTASADQTAKVWDVATGRELFTLKGHRSEIRPVEFSPDGRLIVTGSMDRTAKIWESARGRELFTLKGHRGGIDAAAFSPDGGRIVTGSADQTAKIWDVATGRELFTLEGHSARIRYAAFSPDGQRIVTGAEDQTPKVWDAASGRELFTLKGQAPRFSVSPDSQRIVSGGTDHIARVWDATSGRELLALKGHTGAILSAAYSPDGQRIVTGSRDRTAKVWNATSGQELFTLKGHNAPILSAAYSPDGRRIVTGSGDESAMMWEAPKLWDAASGRELFTLRGHSAKTWGMSFSPDGQQIVTTSVDQTAKVWDAASDRERLTLAGHSDPIRSVAFSRDGQRIVTASDDQTARVWEAASGRELFTLKGHTAPIRSVAYSQDSRRIVTGSSDQTAEVWEAASGQLLLTLKGHSGPIWSVAFSPDGQRIVTGSIDKTAIVWEGASGRQLLTLKGHNGPIWSVAFSPDGQRIVTGSVDRVARVWEAASGRTLLTLKAHNGGIGSVAFSPDGRRIVTGSEDRTAKVWEATSGRELLTLTGHSSSILSVIFSPDGQRIVTGSEDQTAKVWRAARVEEVAAWRVEEQAAAQHLAALQREQAAEQEAQRLARAGDEGAIKRWLVLAPIAIDAQQRGSQAVDTEQIEHEGRLRPKAGERTVTTGGVLTWQEVARENYVIDFNEILAARTDKSVAYAVCYIRSEAEQTGLQMLVSSDDGAKVYLNGNQIHKYAFPHPFLPDEDRVPDIVLNAGLNVLVFKVVNESDSWIGSIRFSDAQGTPVKGITVTLTP